MGADVRPDAVLADLNRLWASLGVSGAPETQGVLRACALTLIVATGQTEEAPAVKQVVAELMRSHPSRAIVLCVSAAHERLEAGVSAECWLPFGQHRQICCEQIEIGVNPARLADLPPLLVALEAPDLPVVLWCRHAPLLQLPEAREIGRAAHKVIFDSAGLPDPFGMLERLAGAASPVYADLAWTRLTGWRERIAAAFDHPARRAQVRSLAEARITYAGAVPPVEALYAGAWIANALGWPPDPPRIRFEPEPGAAGRGLESVALAGPDLSFSIGRADVPEPDETALLGEELGILARDPVYDSVWRLAAHRAGRSGR